MWNQLDQSTTAMPPPADLHVERISITITMYGKESKQQPLHTHVFGAITMFTSLGRGGYNFSMYVSFLMFCY
jgi:hypothetical protein